MLPVHNSIDSNSAISTTLIQSGWFLPLVLVALFFLGGDHSFDRRNHAETSGIDDQLASRADGDWGRRIAAPLLGLFGVLLIRSPGAAHLRVRGALAVSVVLLVGLVLASPLWANNSAVVLRRTIVFVALMLGALGVAVRFSLTQILRTMAVAGCFLLVVGVLAELFKGSFSPFAAGYRFAGTRHPNGQALNCAMIIFCCFGLSLLQPVNVKKYCLVIAATTPFLLLTGSRTTLASAMAGLAVIAFLTWPWRRLVATAVICGLPISLMAVLFSGAVAEKAANVILMGRGAETASLTGRLPLWRDCSTYFLQRPALGYGFNGFWDAEHVDAISRSQQWMIQSAHSVYVEMALGLGIFGLLLFVIILLTGSLGSVTAYLLDRRLEDAFACGVFVWVAIHSSMESWLTNLALPSFLSLVVIARQGFVLQSDDGTAVAASSEDSTS